MENIIYHDVMPEHQKAYPDDCLIIDKALHNPNEYPIGSTVLTSLGKHEITLAGNNCRQVFHNGVRFMEQNRYTGSQYARLANEGHKITWGIRDTNWIYIIDGVIVKH